MRFDSLINFIVSKEYENYFGKLETYSQLLWLYSQIQMANVNFLLLKY